MTTTTRLEAYPQGTHWSVADSEHEQEDILIQGWVRTQRDSKGFSFFEINDGSCLKNIQVVVDHGLVSLNDLKRINTGASLSVIGSLIPSQGKGQKWEIQAKSFHVHCFSDPSYPLQKKGHSLEFLREIAHLRARSNLFGSIFRVRSRLAFAIHQFFQERHFVYIHTPLITASDCEGAGELFRVTTLPLDPIPKKEGQIDFSQDFFGTSTYLTVSGQLEGEVFAMAFSNIYTFGPTFRAENSNTPRHASEFWMIEPEMAFYDLKDNMNFAEEFVKYLIQDILNHCKEDLELFNNFVDKTLFDRLHFVLEKPFQKIPYREAIDILRSSGKQFEFPVSFGVNLQTEHERFLTEDHFRCPVVVYDYPSAVKPFYMRKNEDGETVAAMDILVPKIGEIIGGSQREERLDVLLKNMEEHHLTQKDYSWYIDTRKYGSVLHSGFGLGFERMMMFLTGMSNIRDVIPFARTPGNAAF